MGKKVANWQFQYWGRGELEVDRLFPAVAGGNKKKAKFFPGDLLVTDSEAVRDWLWGQNSWMEVERTAAKVTHRPVKGAFA